MSKKGDFENQKVPNRDFSTKSVPDLWGFPISAVCWGPKNRTNRGIPVFTTLEINSSQCDGQKCNVEVENVTIEHEA